ncbi:MAG: hypothetical protein QOF33_3910 [Thermomicrobiales bacterium]|nr:hypothetical protein [Thermomicrobiales bacterium]
MPIDWIDRLIDDVPPMERYYRVAELDARADDLAAAYPEAVRVERIGTSRAGHPIRMMTIGDGPIPALLFGCPHPNEPIGAQMLDHLARVLAQDADLRERLPFTWYLIPCVDPDGTKLNEGWFDDPGSLLNYARHFYRPPSQEQVEWTFPFAYRGHEWTTPLPETAAVAQAIRSLRPRFVYSLHNCGFGGVYYYLSRPMPDLHPVLRSLAVTHGLPLALGEPEVQWAKRYDDAILGSLSQADHIDHVVAHGGDEAAAKLVRGGGSSYDFAVGIVPDVGHLLCEVPYFLVEGIADGRPSGQLRRDAFLASLEKSEEFSSALDLWLTLLDGTLKVASSFRSAVTETRQWLPASIELLQHMIDTDPEMQREATVAERANALYVDGGYRLLTLSMVPRMVAAERAGRNVSSDEEERLRQVETEATAMIDCWHADLDAGAHYQAVPIQTLVRIELAAGLRMAEYLAGELR